MKVLQMQAVCPFPSNYLQRGASQNLILVNVLCGASIVDQEHFWLLWTDNSVVRFVPFIPTRMVRTVWWVTVYLFVSTNLLQYKTLSNWVAVNVCRNTNDLRMKQQRELMWFKRRNFPASPSCSIHEKLLQHLLLPWFLCLKPLDHFFATFGCV